MFKTKAVASPDLCDLQSEHIFTRGARAHRINCGAKSTVTCSSPAAVRCPPSSAAASQAVLQAPLEILHGICSTHIGRQCVVDFCQSEGRPFDQSSSSGNLYRHHFSFSVVCGDTLTITLPVSNSSTGHPILPFIPTFGQLKFSSILIPLVYSARVFHSP